MSCVGGGDGRDEENDEKGQPTNEGDELERKEGRRED